jgi:hypothetical protein
MDKFGYRFSFGLSNIYKEGGLAHSQPSDEGNSL